MQRTRSLNHAVVALLALAASALARPAAADFPPVTDAERTLKTVSGEPGAPAVTLFKNAELWMMDIARQETSSRLAVRTRVKILTEEGKSHGEISIPHSGYVRLQSFRGRTVLPDGRVVPVPADAKFKRRMSRRDRTFVTSVAFPEVEIGAILDYEYELRFDSLFLLEPWFFSDEVPVAHSEIVYHFPAEIQARVWARDPLKAGLQQDKNQAVRGKLVFRAWADNLPAIAPEPSGVPFSDLATQMMMVPTVFDNGYAHQKLMDDWAATSDLIFSQYDGARRRAGSAKRKAKELAGAPKLSTRDKTSALYRFVRDEIETEELEGVFLGGDSSVDGVLSEKRGHYAEKALLLETMLDAVKVDARLVWASDRGRGIIDVQLPNPTWFQKVLVAAQIDGQRVFLDPSDTSLGMGQLQPGYEGTPAVLPDRKKPETITLPDTPFDQNRREAALDLALDAEGALAGSGRLTFAGHHAWQRIGWIGDSPTAEEAWKKWLEEELDGFRVAGVKIEESVEERKLEVSWSMAQREEDALGDEAAVVPSRPLGPVTQPFVLGAARRRSPVLFEYGDRDDVTLTLRWPEGWQVESSPKPAARTSPAGAIAVSVEVDEPARALTYKRRLDITRKSFESRDLFEAIRNLFAETEKSDGQSIVLVRR